MELIDCGEPVAGGVLCTYLRSTWLPCLVAAAVLVGCGGGGDDVEPPPWSGLTIDTPADADTFTTVESTLDLAGYAFVPQGSACDSYVGTIAPGYSIRWRNSANATSGVARMQLNCLLAVSLTWHVSAVALAPGVNVVTVTATAADGRTGVDSIEITRGP